MTCFLRDLRSLTSWKLLRFFSLCVCVVPRGASALVNRRGAGSKGRFRPKLFFLLRFCLIIFYAIEQTQPRKPFQKGGKFSLFAISVCVCVTWRRSGEPLFFRTLLKMHLLPGGFTSSANENNIPFPGALVGPFKLSGPNIQHRGGNDETGCFTELLLLLLLVTTHRDGEKSIEDWKARSAMTTTTAGRRKKKHKRVWHPSKLTVRRVEHGWDDDKDLGQNGQAESRNWVLKLNFYVQW